MSTTPTGCTVPGGRVRYPITDVAAPPASPRGISTRSSGVSKSWLAWRKQCRYRAYASSFFGEFAVG
jgi:hypothetical protein